jgi:hypothetical protein
MSATESHEFSNLAATTLQFPILGGKYSFDASGTWGSGNAQVELLGPDGSTWLNVGSSVFKRSICRQANIASRSRRELQQSMPCLLRLSRTRRTPRCAVW